MVSGIANLVARVLIAAMFLSSGYSALSDIPATAGYFASLGLEPPTLAAWGTGIFELATGILLVIGLLSRPVAIVLALFTVTATWLGHYGQGDDPFAVFMHSQALIKDVAVAGGLILLALQGAGRISVDHWRAGERAAKMVMPSSRP